MLTMIGAAPRASVQPWNPSTNYAAGAQVVAPTLGPTPPPGFSLIFQCNPTAGALQGTSGSSAPTWPTSVGGTVLDGTVGTQISWQAIQDPLSIDTDDPYGVAASAIGETASASTGISPLTPNTWSVPLIVSCGVDGQLGLYEPYDTANFGSLAQPVPRPFGTTEATGQFWRDVMNDNITNHQQ
jgi:hypothetical protein